MGIRMTYTFRIRFKRATRGTVASDTHEIQLSAIGMPSLRLHSYSRDEPISKANELVLTGDPFDSADEAMSAGMRCQSALLVALARHRIGADFGVRSPKPGTATSYLLDKLKTEAGARVLNDKYGLDVFETEPTPRFLKMGGLNCTIGTNCETFERTFSESANRIGQMTESEAVAFSLFNSSFFADYSDARFLLLMMSIEALIDVRPRQEQALAFVDSLVQQAKAAQMPESDKRSIISSLGFLKCESISQAGRRLVSERLGDRAYLMKPPPKFFTHCYDLRSRLVHGLAPFPSREEIGEQAATLEVFVSDLLTAPTLGPLQ
jgi:hypothetical protein